jgi:ariadne-1
VADGENADELLQAQFMSNAVDELSRCRETLKWTYATAHFLDAGNEKEIFEDNQACGSYLPLSSLN